MAKSGKKSSSNIKIGAVPSAGTAPGLIQTERVKAEEQAVAKGGTEVPISEGVPMPVAEFAASQISAFVDSNDFTVLFGRQVPYLVANGAVGAVKMPAAAIHFSPQTAKDLVVLLGGLIEQYEADWGTIDTAYLRALAEGKKGKSG